ncbi:MAG: hypothetical protein ACFFCW_00625 [Candidatus Hodarchaeota archaeon]
METTGTNQIEHIIENALTPERNCVIVEEWFRQIEWSGKLAAVLLFNLLTSESERYRNIGRHILRNLNENIYETEGLTSQEDMYVRELLFAVAERKMKKGA